MSDGIGTFGEGVEDDYTLTIEQEAREQVADDDTGAVVITGRRSAGDHHISGGHKIGAKLPASVQVTAPITGGVTNNVTFDPIPPDSLRVGWPVSIADTDAPDDFVMVKSLSIDGNGWIVGFTATAPFALDHTDRPWWFLYWDPVMDRGHGHHISSTLEPDGTPKLHLGRGANRVELSPKGLHLNGHHIADLDGNVRSVAPHALHGSEMSLGLEHHGYVLFDQAEQWSNSQAVQVYDSGTLTASDSYPTSQFPLDDPTKPGTWATSGPPMTSDYVLGLSALSADRVLRWYDPTPTDQDGITPRVFALTKDMTISVPVYTSASTALTFADTATTPLDGSAQLGGAKGAIDAIGIGLKDSDGNWHRGYWGDTFTIPSDLAGYVNLGALSLTDSAWTNLRVKLSRITSLTPGSSLTIIAVELIVHSPGAGATVYFDAVELGHTAHRARIPSGHIREHHIGVEAVKSRHLQRVFPINNMLMLPSGLGSISLPAGVWDDVDNTLGVNSVVGYGEYFDLVPASYSASSNVVRALWPAAWDVAIVPSGSGPPLATDAAWQSVAFGWSQHEPFTQLETLATFTQAVIDDIPFTGRTVGISTVYAPPIGGRPVIRGQAITWAFPTHHVTAIDMDVYLRWGGLTAG